jgi:biotin-dependent carboxylase-like uncharacterized protein
MSFTIVHPGLYDTLQDKGRHLMTGSGIPQSGAMDDYLMGMANLLVGKPQNAACIEIFSFGPKLYFEQDTQIAVTALAADLYLNNQKININEALWAYEGDELLIKQVTQGNFAYLAVLGDIQSEAIAGSQSFHKAVNGYQRLEKGMAFRVDQSEVSSFDKAHAHIKIDIDAYKTKRIRVIKGPNFNQLSTDAQYQLLHNNWLIGDNITRMGFQLKDRIHHELDDILTAMVVPGTVQLNHAGNLMILMKDAQTTGGYPRVLQVLEEDLNQLAQKQVGSPIRFELVD